MDTVRPTDVVSAKVLVVQVVGVLPHVAHEEREAQAEGDGVLGIVRVRNLCSDSVEIATNDGAASQRRNGKGGDWCHMSIEM